MDTSEVIFSITAAQLALLRAIAKNPVQDFSPDARHDPRLTLVSKGLLSEAGRSYSQRFSPTPFGLAILDGLKYVNLSRHHQRRAGREDYPHGATGVGSSEDPATAAPRPA